jgi:hypothetical protein
MWMYLTILGKHPYLMVEHFFFSRSAKIAINITQVEVSPFFKAMCFNAHVAGGDVADAGWISTMTIQSELCTEFL